MTMTRVLVIKTSSMGDIVHNMPVIADLCRALPDVVIDWIVEEAYVDLVRMVRGIDRVIPVALRRWRRSPYRGATRDERRAFDATLREVAYDVVLDTQGLVKSGLIAQRARLTRNGFRAGFSFRLAREPIARLFYHRGYPVDPRLHAIERMRALAASACGYRDVELGPPRFELDVPDRGFGWIADATTSSRGYVVLLHASARPEKAWPAERWTGLVELLCESGIVPVLPWGNDLERDAAQALASSSRHQSSSSPLVAPRLSLPECAALFAGALGVVGVDTGLLHLAAAIDIPTVGLFGATPRWRYAPYWSPQAINLGSFDELGAQPGLDAVADALRRLGVLPPTA